MENIVVEKICSNCAYCILWRGQTRCGRCEDGYKPIDRSDNGCKYFILFEEDEEEEEPY